MGREGVLRQPYGAWTAGELHALMGMEPGSDEHKAQLQELQVFLAGLRQELRLFEGGKWVQLQECAFCNDLYI
jgi:hypothetical protein